MYKSIKKTPTPTKLYAARITQRLRKQPPHTHHIINTTSKHTLFACNKKSPAKISRAHI